MSRQKKSMYETRSYKLTKLVLALSFGNSLRSCPSLSMPTRAGNFHIFCTSSYARATTQSSDNHRRTWRSSRSCQDIGVIFKDTGRWFYLIWSCWYWRLNFTTNMNSSQVSFFLVSFINMRIKALWIPLQISKKKLASNLMLNFALFLMPWTTLRSLWKLKRPSFERWTEARTPPPARLATTGFARVFR